MEIIPAIDIIDGKCVRLSQGDYKRKKTYASDPVAVARKFEDAGIGRLHLVDLDGARSDHIVNLNVLENIAGNTGLIIDFGGGVKTDMDVADAMNAGAAMVTGGSVAVRQPEIFESWLVKYGPEKIILGADVKERQIAVEGWRETSDQDIFEFLGYYFRKSVKFVICTDIMRDGVLSGPSVDLYTEIIKQFPEVNLIASGGVKSVEDLDLLSETGVWGVIIGKAIYEGRIRLEDLKIYLD